MLRDRLGVKPPLFFTTKHLCTESSRHEGFPWCSVSDDGVEDDEELSHGRSDGDLRGLSGCAQACVEGLDNGVASDGGNGRHIEDSADSCAAAPDRAASAEHAAVTIEGR
jgi:hypothetical protein